MKGATWVKCDCGCDTLGRWVTNEDIEDLPITDAIIAELLTTLTATNDGVTVNVEPVE